MNPKNIALAYKTKIKIMRSSYNFILQKVKFRPIIEEINKSNF